MTNRLQRVDRLLELFLVGAEVFKFGEVICEHVVLIHLGRADIN